MEDGDMITTATGNLLDADVDALVNTVNTVGVMGKGIALQFKRAYPGMFKDYARAAKRGELALGQVHVWPTQQMAGPRFIINFPTKGHWRAKSQITDIEAGLSDLVDTVERLGLTSLALPPLGCGHGGLRWSEVEPMIRRSFESLPGVDVLLFPPEGAPPAAEMVSSGEPPRMTLGRAALIDLVSHYTTHAFDGPSLIGVQKLMYFLQEAGEPLGLDYVRSYYGPYADGLRHVLKDLEGHYLVGFGDGSRKVEESEPIELLPDARDAARLQLVGDPSTRERIERVVRLLDGFDSAYGLELLATVHWVTEHEHAAERDEIVEAVQQWSLRKGRMFDRHHIVTALNALQDRGWVTGSLLV